jgi:hypothetical protein
MFEYKPSLYTLEELETVKKTIPFKVNYDEDEGYEITMDDYLSYKEGLKFYAEGYLDYLTSEKFHPLFSCQGKYKIECRNHRTFDVFLNTKVIQTLLGREKEEVEFDETKIISEEEYDLLFHEFMWYIEFFVFFYSKRMVDFEWDIENEGGDLYYFFMLILDPGIYMENF